MTYSALQTLLCQYTMTSDSKFNQIVPSMDDLKKTILLYSETRQMTAIKRLTLFFSAASHYSKILSVQAICACYLHYIEQYFHCIFFTKTYFYFGY